jgi:hypothetical protein
MERTKHCLVLFLNKTEARTEAPTLTPLHVVPGRTETTQTRTLQNDVFWVSAAAHLGDMSWWLQYSPALAHALSAKATLMVATIMVVVVLLTSPAEAAPGTGVNTVTSTMHAMGPTKARP